jgi:hypothetical protein
MKIIFLLVACCLLGNYSFAQFKMVMTVKDQKCDILGYAMDPDASGNQQSISIFGPMQNAETILQLSYASGNPIGNIVISITNPSSAANTTITLTEVTVYGFKQYLSTYSNGIFNISSNGNENAEVKCKFNRIETHTNSGTGSGISKENIMGENLNPLTNQKWEMQPDPSLKGVTGQLVIQMPKAIPIMSHLQAFKSGDTKVAASWFGNNKSNLIPGTYDILLEKYKLNNVPIEKGKTTRLKVGLLNFTPRQSVTIVDGSQQKFAMAGPFKIVLPVGTYYIDGKKDQAFVMKDGEQTDY